MMDEQQNKQGQGGAMHAPQALPEPPEPFEPVAEADALARDLVALRTQAPHTAIGAAILRRFDTSGAPGLHAAGLGVRFAPKAMRAPALPLTVSPYAPPQRQLSTARQGAAMWRPQQAAVAAPAIHQPVADPADHVAPVPPASPPRATARDSDELPDDLKRLLALHREKGRI